MAGPHPHDADILDPSLHGEGVDTFLRHYSINQHHPDIPLLEAILGAFSHFPFENISKIIKHQRNEKPLEKLRLPREVMEDHARFRFGGTCFSLTFFLQMILTRSRYSCYPVMADMRAGQNTHCALVVQMDSSKYLVDPGYLLSRPMEMCTARPRIYDTDYAGVELVFHPDQKTHDLYTFNRSEMKWRYRFVDRPVPPEEFLRYWQSSFYWNSMHGLCLTKAERGKMVYIHKTHMRETTYSIKKNTNIKQTLHHTVETVFGISSEWVESALAAIPLNMVRERELGLWLPKDQRQFLPNKTPDTTFPGIVPEPPMTSNTRDDGSGINP